MADEKYSEPIKLIAVEAPTDLANVDRAVEVALPINRRDAIRNAVSRSRAKRTRYEYGKQFERFARWCEEHGRAPVPATTETVAAYLTALQDGSATGRKWAPSSLEVALSAVIVANRSSGHRIDRKADALNEVISGAKTLASEGRSPRKVAPIKSNDLRILLDLGNADDLLTRRDNALLGLGFAAALRRSEIVGLDFAKRGDGTGYVEIIEAGVRITLLTSKAAQGEAVEIAIPRRATPTVCDAITDWVQLAGLEPGKPMFQRIGKGRKRQTGERISDRQVARIIKTRVRARALAFGASKAEADEIAGVYAGHSLRAGFITSAAEKSVPVYAIQDHSRHKTAEMVREYIRDVDRWQNNPLNKFGF